jgi:type I restriction enzyme S subunit
MSAVDEGRGVIAAVEERPFAEVRKGYTPFRDGDVLFAKVTPCMENGKAAIAQGLRHGMGFGSTEFHVLRPNPALITPEYVFHFVRQPWFREQAASAFIGTGGLQRVPPGFFKRVKLPLPPLPEQQRIVEVLHQFNEALAGFSVRRTKLVEVVDQQLAAAIAGCRDKDWLPLSGLVTPKYGTSARADADEANGVPVLRIPNVVGGEVDVVDLKYVDLPKAEQERLRLTIGDVLIVRSNGNPDYVGRCAAVDEATALLEPVYASYLIRLRPDQERLLGSYLAALLNSPVGRTAMRNAIRTTAGQSNLSAESLAGIRIPVPSLEEQQHFAEVWQAAQTIRRQFDASERTATKLNTALIAEALSGRLTAAWREQNAEELAQAARARDEQLGAPLPQVTVRITEYAPAERRTDLARPRRQALIEQLSSFQHEVWNMLRFEWRSAVLADDPAAFDEFCTSPQTAWRLDGFQAGREEVRRALEQLAAMGLIRKMSLPRANPNTRRTEYLTAFRPLREAEDGGRAEEDTALADAQRLARELERPQAPQGQ